VSAEKQVNPQVTSLREHPTAGPAIRRAKGLAGLAGFSVTAFIGFEAGFPSRSARSGRSRSGSPATSSSGRAPCSSGNGS